MKRVLVVLAATAVTAFGAAAPASAHEGGHSGCKPGVSPVAQVPGPGGQGASEAAKQGGLQDEAETLHLACQHRGGP